MLLGLLVTILTMVFNQSSIAWRTATAVTANMDDVRDNVAELRDEADNAFVYGNEIYRTVGLWKKDGTLRDRACDAPGSSVASETGARAALLRKKARSFLLQRQPWKNGSSLVSVDGAENGSKPQTYVVNVRSLGPNNNAEDWQAVFSYPDDPEEWCK